MKKGTFRDIAGSKFGRLLALERNGKTIYGESKWLCQCDCGNRVTLRHGALTSGNTQSCGCWNTENLKTVNRTHGDSYSRLYKIWSGMKKRCYNQGDKNFHLYGGRGIVVCREWREDYPSFKAWALTNGYADNLTIERKDADGHYQPENCEWVTLNRQANNKRSNVVIATNGESHTMAEWCNIKGLSYRLVKTRHGRGWDEGDLFKPPGMAREHPMLSKKGGA